MVSLHTSQVVPRSLCFADSFNKVTFQEIVLSISA